MKWRIFVVKENKPFRSNKNVHLCHI